MHAVFHQVGDGDQRHVVLFREPGQLRHTGHRAVLVHDLADHACRVQPGNAGEVHGRLGVSGTGEHAAWPRTQREHMTGTHQIARPRPIGDREPHGPRAIGRRDSRRDAVFRVNRHAERRFTTGRVRRHFQRDVELIQPFAGHRQANQPAPVPRHEVDGFGRDLLRRDRQIALVLAILIVDHNDDLPIADRLDGIFNMREGRVRLREGQGSRAMDFLLDFPFASCLLPFNFHSHCRTVSPASSAARTTYFPTMSHSRLTRSPA